MNTFSANNPEQLADMSTFSSQGLVLRK
uniref:Uncharacterized protein n=1 Tax=Rhizophora mucronata TaxID=61149 RepID=A0A2P2QJ90_RHIMU